MKMRPLPWVGMASTYSQQKGTKQTIILSNSCQIRALSQGSPIDSSGRVRGQACLCELTRPADGRMADHSLRCVPPLLYPAVSCALIPIIVRTAAGCEMTAGLEPLVCSCGLHSAKLQPLGTKKRKRQCFAVKKKGNRPQIVTSRAEKLHARDVVVAICDGTYTTSNRPRAAPIVSQRGLRARACRETIGPRKPGGLVEATRGRLGRRMML